MLVLEVVSWSWSRVGRCILYPVQMYSLPSSIAVYMFYLIYLLQFWFLNTLQSIHYKFQTAQLLHHFLLSLFLFLSLLLIESTSPLSSPIHPLFSLSFIYLSLCVWCIFYFVADHSVVVVVDDGFFSSDVYFICCCFKKNKAATMLTVQMIFYPLVFLESSFWHFFGSLFVRRTTMYSVFSMNVWMTTRKKERKKERITTTNKHTFPQMIVKNDIITIVVLGCGVYVDLQSFIEMWKMLLELCGKSQTKTSKSTKRYATTSFSSFFSSYSCLLNE